MSVLREDNYRRRGSGRPRRPRLRGMLLFMLLFVSLGLMLLSRFEHAVVRGLRNGLNTVFAPVLTVAAVPVSQLRRAGAHISNQFVLSQELERLREENQRLRSWEWRAREVERKFTQLAALARAVEEPSLAFLTGRVIADANSPFVRSVLVNIGRQRGVKNGYAVMNADGVVGRIVESGTATSRVLLLSDVSSRIPVLIGPAGIRGFLAGDNGPMPRLEHVADDAKLYPGDEVFTSGDGGVFPRGMRVGVLEAAGSERRVRLHARLRELEYVSVLYFDTPLLEITDSEPAPSGRLRPVGRRVPRRDAAEQ